MWCAIAKNSFVLSVVIAAMTALSCHSLGCGNARPGGEALVEIAQVEAGDAPTIVILRVYPAGLIELEPVGQKRRCARVDVERLEMLKGILASEGFEKILGEESGGRSLFGVEDSLRLVIKANGRRWRRRPEELRGKAAELVEIVLLMFDDAFPVRFKTIWRTDSRADISQEEISS